jgi:diguanylate cyclase (GGDEF)-like protein/PAS domain S-box-containing protein
MNYQNPLYVALLIISATITFSASFIAWNRKAPGSAVLRVLLMFMSLWSAASAAQYFQPSLEGKVFWLNVTMIPIVVAPVLFLVFALQFNGNPYWLASRALSAIYILSAANLLLQWTNPFHRLVLSSIQLVELNGYPVLELQRGPLYFFNLGFAYTMITLGMLVLIHGAFRSGPLYRSQYRLLLLGCVIPWAFSVYSQIKFDTISGLDTSPISFGITGIIFVFATLRTGLMDLIPVARTRLIENMGDGVLVLDAQHRIVDINSAMEALLAEKSSAVLGQNIIEILGGWVEQSSGIFGDSDLQTELRIPSASSRFLDLRMTPLRNKDGQVTGRLLVFRDITDRKEVEKKLRDANFRLKSQLIEIGILQSQLREQAVRDPLTGLFNRRYLEETLDRELARAARESYPVCLIMIDIDHFKRVNDTYGHEAGDVMLKALSGEILNHSRRGDFACRYGGEEFVIVMPNMTINIVQERAAVLRNALKALQVNYGLHILTATYSMGIASYPANGDSRNALLRAADTAMYAAKHAGRDDIRSFDQIEAISK